VTNRLSPRIFTVYSVEIADRIYISLWLLISILLAGCQKDQGPPKIRYGEETCDHCRMIISEDRFAAAYRLNSGLVKKFDDIGCAIQHQEKMSDSLLNPPLLEKRNEKQNATGANRGSNVSVAEPDVTKSNPANSRYDFWVRDYTGTLWIGVNQACFVYSDNLQTPMGYGVVATSTQTKAHQLAQAITGKVLTLNQVKKSVYQQTK